MSFKIGSWLRSILLGQPNGVAQLDASGKIPLSQLPTSSGDMQKSVYDSTGKESNVYDYANSIGVTQVTDNIISPVILTANQNDYDPIGFDDANVIRQDFTDPAGGAKREITGFKAPPVGVNRIISIVNINASDDLRFKHNDSASIAANRILLRGNNNRKDIMENEMARFWYDHISLRWRPYTRVG